MSASGYEGGEGFRGPDSPFEANVSFSCTPGTPARLYLRRFQEVTKTEAGGPV